MSPHIFYDGKKIKCSICSTEDFQPEQGQPKLFKLNGSRDLNNKLDQTYYWIGECFTCNKKTSYPDKMPYLYY